MIQRITIKELVEFKRKSTDRSKKNFANKLKFREAKQKIDSDKGGGDYWIISTSCIYKVFKHNTYDLYDPKIDEIRLKFENAEDKRSKSMYQRNLDILTNFKDFDFRDFRPSNISKFETVQKVQKIVNVQNFPIYVSPSLLFVYERNGKQELGALWLVPQKDGFNKSELGLFCEMLYRFLIKNYSEDYQISEDYCIVIDTYNAQNVIYADLVKGNIPALIDRTLDEMKNLN